MLCAVQVSNPAKAKRRSSRHRPRSHWASRGTHAQRDSENLKGSAVKESTTVATLNFTTLKLEGEDEFSLRRCTRLNEVLAFMQVRGVGVMCLQETRYNFSKEGHEDGILYRQVENLVERFHLYLQSAAARDSYNGMAIVSRHAFRKVWMVSNRVMGAEYPLEEGTSTLFNVYAPIRDSSEAVHAAFLGDLDKARREVKAERKRRPLLVMGDFNAPITLVTNPSMDPPAVSNSPRLEI